MLEDSFTADDVIESLTPELVIKDRLESRVCTAWSIQPGDCRRDSRHLSTDAD